MNPYLTEAIEKAARHFPEMVMVETQFGCFPALKRDGDFFAIENGRVSQTPLRGFPRQIKDKT